MPTATATAPAPDWESHFSSLAGSQSPAPPQVSVPTDWVGHFSALAPGDQSAAPTPPQYQGLLREPLLAAKDIGQGISELVTLPGDLLNIVNGPPTGKPGDMYGGAHIGPPVDFGPLGVHQLGLPTAADIAPVTNALGLTSTPQLTNTSPKEKFAGAAIGAVPSIALGIATGGGTLPMTAWGEGGALLGEAAHQFAPGNKWLPGVAAIVGGFGVNKVRSLITGALEGRAAVKALAAAEDTFKSAEDNLFSGNYQASVAATAAKRASAAKLATTKQLGETTVANAQTQTQNELESVAGELGSSETHQQAGEVLKDSTASWLNDSTPGTSSFNNGLTAAWAPVNKAVPDTMQLPLSEFTKTLQGINESAGGLEPLNQLMKPALPAKLWAKLKSMGESDTAELTGEGTAGEGPDPNKEFSWRDARTLKSTLGGLLKDPIATRDLGAQNAANLYRALSTDARVGADQAGATQLFDQANEESSKLYDLAQGPVAKVLDPARDPEAVASSLLAGKGRSTQLEALRQVAPDGVNELAAAHLRQPGAWTKLSPESQEALVPSPDLRARLDSAVQLSAQAKANVESEVSQAENDHKLFSQSVDDGLAKGNFDRASAVRQAREARDTARAGLPPTPEPFTNWAHSIANATGAGLGWQFAPTIINHLGLDSGPLTSAAVSAVGFALPMMVRAGKTALQQPGSMRGPMVSALAGENTLALTPPPASRK